MGAVTPKLPTACPCCGTPIATSRPIVDLNTNTLAWGGNKIKLSPIETEIVHAVVTAYPAPVRITKVLASVWGGAEPNSNALSVHMANVRRHIAPLGLRIDTVSRHSYQLTVQRP